MKCVFQERNSYTSLFKKLEKYHLLITIIAENLQEAFDIGVLSERLRNHGVYCALNPEQPSITVRSICIEEKWETETK